MNYDKQTGGELITIQANLETIKGNSTSMIIDLPLELPEDIDYDLNLSWVEVYIKRGDNIIYKRLGQFVDSFIVGDNLKAYIIEYPLPATEPTDSISIKARLFLTSNTFFDFSKENLGVNTPITLLYNY